MDILSWIQRRSTRASLWISGSPKRTSDLVQDFTGMGKGETWVNGQSIGRYWSANIAQTSGCSDCSYKEPCLNC
ncbi:putative beta-galactosidase [Helianthus debilis subsp. tardiflorus]